MNIDIAHTFRKLGQLPLITIQWVTTEMQTVGLSCFPLFQGFPARVSHVLNLARRCFIENGGELDLGSRKPGVAV